MILILTALPCEAGPLISRFRLKSHNKSSWFKTYKNKDILLTVSGVGKVRMGAAIAYSVAYSVPLIQPATGLGIINIGIAGHRNMAIGKLVAAKKITDAETGNVWIPKFRTNSIPDYVNLVTSNTPVASYSGDSIFDMEASGFAEIANLFTSLSLIQSLKIVSDNQNNPSTMISKQGVIELMSLKIEQIVCFIDELKARILTKTPS